MIRYLQDRFLEDEYIISDEMKNATLFGIGNGYFGQRGSFEEFGDVFIQGTYVRGVFDSIVEIPHTISDNSYMKKYYFDEEKLKEFEKEDSCINIGDISSIRIYIDRVPFRLWNYKIISYERYLDFSNGGLVREIVVEDEKGNQTMFSFYKVCSFAHDHIFLQTLKIKKLNHNLPISLSSGIDLLCKTNGQHKIENVSFSSLKNDASIHTIKASYGDKYKMKGYYFFKNETEHLIQDDREESTFGLFDTYQLLEKEGEIRKIVSFYSNIDKRNGKIPSHVHLENTYDFYYKEHLKKYQNCFKKVDISIKGNKELDTLVRYANYQTLIGFNRHDAVHSLSAKNLTAEKYNQFVWWDCEIYQMPFFLLTFPKGSKNLLLYRYNRLEEAKKNAKKDGYRGAKFAFCSSVKGDEQVWIYAKHPFLQIHINSDIAYAIIQYYIHTLDRDFLKEYGLEMMEQIILYFYSRSTYQDGKYHLCMVTGTDEHHDYVNNDAYTNITLKFVLDHFLTYKKKFGYQLKEMKEEELNDFASNLYLPSFENGILPQFDGYLSLMPSLPVEGKSNAKASSFQMKQSGLYHLSQIIKQPDVLLLYSYLNLSFKENYEQNYRFYLEKCEASSSLTYAVHALAAIDNNDEKAFKDNLYSSLKIDIDDIQGNASDGVHAGSLASGFYLFVRGIVGIIPQEDCLEINPKRISFLKGFRLHFTYQGNTIYVYYRPSAITISSKHPFVYRLNGGEKEETTKLVMKYDSLNHLYKKEIKI